MSYTIEAYEDKLLHQVIHLDQGACYCPEYRATQQLVDYPSRKMQLGWSVYKGYLEPSDFIADTLYNSMLSGAGERWLAFEEAPDDFSDAMILCRQMLAQKGFGKAAGQQLQAALAQNGGHLPLVNSEAVDAWQSALPTDSATDTWLLLDDATAASCSAGAENLGNWLRGQKRTIFPDVSPVFLGFEFFACGLVEEGTTHLQKMVDTIAASGAKRVLCLSGQGEYLLGHLCGKLGIQTPFAVESLIDSLTPLAPGEPSFVYGGGFYSRYLAKADKLNALVPNASEQPRPASAEFLPLLQGDKRLNVVNIYERPFCPEYQAFGLDENIVAAVFEDAATQLQLSGVKAVLSFEPCAVAALRASKPDVSAVHYLELL